VTVPRPLVNAIMLASVALGVLAGFAVYGVLAGG
jgi:hypothetical protein